MPDGQRLTATVTASAGSLPDGGAGFKPTLNFVVGACASSLNCVAGTSAASGAGETTTTWDNFTGAAQSVLLIVDTTTSVPAGSFSLSVATATVTRPPGDVCANVGPAITTDTSRMGETLVGYGNEWSGATLDTNCTFLGGPDRVYAVTVQPGMRLTALASSTTANLAISIVDGPAAACLASPVVCAVSTDANGTGVAETVKFDNTTAAATTVFVIIDRTSGTLATDTFDLGISMTTAPATLPGGETCAAPAMVGANTTVLSTTTGLMNDFVFADVGSCQGTSTTSTAPDAVFQTTIPPNSRLTVSATAAWDLVLNVIASPAATCGTGMGAGIVCLGGVDSNSSGTESLVVSNPSTTTGLVVYILVDGYSTGVGAFELTTSTAVIPPPAYAKTTPAQACVTLAGSTDLLGAATTPVIGDDVVSATLALPFVFSFFATPVTHFAASSNGLVQFFTSAVGSGSSAYNNAAISTTATPNGFAAPFWDDLVPSASTAPSTVVRMQTTGTAPNRKLIVEWFDASFSGNVERLRFQLHAYETTNVIEFHYCSLVSNTGGSLTRPFGSEATVGVENAAGTEGVQHSFNTAASVNTTTALRFTPQ